MRRVLFSIGILFVLVLPTLAIQDTSPTIAFDSLSKDFGKVFEGEAMKHVFKFTNKGNATLEIIKVEPT